MEIITILYLIINTNLLRIFEDRGSLNFWLKMRGENVSIISASYIYTVSLTDLQRISGSGELLFSSLFICHLSSELTGPLKTKQN